MSSIVCCRLWNAIAHASRPSSSAPSVSHRMCHVSWYSVVAKRAVVSGRNERMVNRSPSSSTMRRCSLSLTGAPIGPSSHDPGGKPTTESSPRERSPRSRARLRHFQMQSTFCSPDSLIHSSWLAMSVRTSAGSSRAPISSRHCSWSALVGLATISRFANTPPGASSCRDLGVEGALARVRHVMDGERRDDRVERAVERQRILEVVHRDGDPVVPAEAVVDGCEHRWRHIHARRGRLRVRAEHERGQPSVAAAEIEDPSGQRAREVTDQHPFALATVREPIGPGEILGGLVRISP